VLLVALWLAGDKGISYKLQDHYSLAILYLGQKHLKRLSELSEDEETKELINTLAAKPPPDPLQSEFSVANLDMNMQILVSSPLHVLPFLQLCKVGHVLCLR